MAFEDENLTSTVAVVIVDAGGKGQRSRVSTERRSDWRCVRSAQNSMSHENRGAESVCFLDEPRASFWKFVHLLAQF